MDMMLLSMLWTSVRSEGVMRTISFFPIRGSGGRGLGRPIVSVETVVDCGSGLYWGVSAAVCGCMERVSNGLGEVSGGGIGSFYVLGL